MAQNRCRTHANATQCCPNSRHPRHVEHAANPLPCNGALVRVRRALYGCERAMGATDRSQFHTTVCDMCLQCWTAIPWINQIYSHVSTEARHCCDGRIEPRGWYAPSRQIDIGPGRKRSAPNRRTTKQDAHGATCFVEDLRRLASPLLCLLPSLFSLVICCLLTPRDGLAWSIGQLLFRCEFQCRFRHCGLRTCYKVYDGSF